MTDAVEFRCKSGFYPARAVICHGGVLEYLHNFPVDVDPGEIIRDFG